MSISELYRGIVAPAGVTSEKPANNPASTPKGGPEFREFLSQELKLSQHAQTRINSREIKWDAAIEKRISGGIDAADKKGARETLILADDLAVIANVKSRTIVTAMDRSQLKERIFTNIDSAVLV